MTPSWSRTLGRIRWGFLATIGIALPLIMDGTAAAESSPGERVDVFSNGEAGYPVFRIPSLLALDGAVLLAFAEGRIPKTPEQHDDHACNDIVLRRSLDGGKSWGAIQVVADMGGDSLNDPCAVHIPTLGRTLLLYQRFPEGFHARRMEHTDIVEPGYGGPRNTQSFLVFSDDQGETWSEPVEVTRSIRRDDAISVGSPGVGLVLRHGPRSGRIVLPLYEVIHTGDGEERLWRNCVAVSDDEGESWRLGERVPIDGLSGFGNECQVAELEDGTLRMHARLQSEAHRVAWSTSQDGGETWTPMKEASDLVTTPCMTSLVAVHNPAGGRAALLASLPYSDTGRENGTLFLSRDQGRTWSAVRTLYPGGFAYSSLAPLTHRRVACLFERGPYEHLSLTILDLDSIPE